MMRPSKKIGVWKPLRVCGSSEKKAFSPTGATTSILVLGCPNMINRRNCVYDEVSGHQCLLKYMVSQAGGCKVLLHPKWQTACYPATIFTTAPSQIVLEALGHIPVTDGRPQGAVSEGDPTPTPLRIAQDLVQTAGAGEYWGRIQGVGGTSVGELRRLFEEVRFDDGGQLDFVPPNTRLSIKAGLDQNTFIIPMLGWERTSLWTRN